ncbi:4Fe-4S dicluster domain-containing protein, partial [Bdellovibrionota bacterium FG-2]
AWVVSAGPFRDFPAVREHPPGSLLFELEQTAFLEKVSNVEGWVLEEERGRALGGRIVRALVTDFGKRREEFEQIWRRSRGRVRRYSRHRSEAFSPVYQGKWIAPTDMATLRAFSGVPKKEHHKKPIASVECFESIPCDVCKRVCPEGAIETGRVPRPEQPVLSEEKCTGCGLCAAACPSSAIVLLHERDAHSMSRLIVPWKKDRLCAEGDFVEILNRRGEVLGNGRAQERRNLEGGALLAVDLPSHLLWEARSVRRRKTPVEEGMAYLDSVERASALEEKVEVSLNGERRFVRDHVSVSIGLFETGRNRPEDALLCRDGSCGLCTTDLDGVKKLGCKAEVHRGMAIRSIASPRGLQKNTDDPDLLCECLGITRAQVAERMQQGKLKSAEAVLSVIHVGEGKCHGQRCQGTFRRFLQDQGLDVSQWIDWRFPSTDWVLTRN